MLAHEAWLSSRIGRADPPRGEAGFVAVLPAESPSAQYIAFDWHEGVTLQTLLKSGTPMDVADVVAAAIAIARALGRLHRTGVIHRDVKPANLHPIGRRPLADPRPRRGAVGPRVRRRAIAARRHAELHEPGAVGPRRQGPQPADEASDLYRARRHAVPVADRRGCRTARSSLTRPAVSGTTRSRRRGSDRTCRSGSITWCCAGVALDARQRFETAEETGARARARRRAAAGDARAHAAGRARPDGSCGRSRSRCRCC